ncbi:hypothetical protein WN943_006518 [Citrus x changshan-huyou]
MVKEDGFQVWRPGPGDNGIFCSIKLVDYMHSTSTIWKWEKIMLSNILYGQRVEQRNWAIDYINSNKFMQSPSSGLSSFFAL